MVGVGLGLGFGLGLGLGLELGLGLGLGIGLGLGLGLRSGLGFVWHALCNLSKNSSDYTTKFRKSNKGKFCKSFFANDVQTFPEFEQLFFKNLIRRFCPCSFF